MDESCFIRSMDKAAVCANWVLVPQLLGGQAVVVKCKQVQVIATYPATVYSHSIAAENKNHKMTTTTTATITARWTKDWDENQDKHVRIMEMMTVATVA